ncbi:MAG: hypothetical protein A2068_15155 [Ignavibacteria bacterium GWB2_35_6b]|nr:MAG: hypothetical protein A2068_15155 [Ignavibacteria bacterium GWB2_35_6b]
MVLSDSKLTDIIGQRTDAVGYINGEEISYQDFTQLVERARQNQAAQTGQEITEEQMDYFRDQVWEALVTQRLVDEKINELGITVSDEEISNLIMGENPPQFLKQNFIDSTGNFNRDAYNTALFDPRNKEVLLQVEDQVKNQIIQQKLQDYFNASIVVTEDEIKEAFYDQAVKMNAEYLVFSIRDIADNMISFTDEDVKKYYEEHKEEYKVDEQRKIKYVLFEQKPSESDTLAVSNNLKAIAAKIQTDTSTFKGYVDIYSDVPYSKDTVGISNVDPNAQDVLKNSATGSIIGPVLTGSGYELYKLVDRVKSNDTFAKASHILIRFGDNKEAALVEANKAYDRISKGENFAAVAKEVSQDPSNAPKGGDLGWFGKNQMVKEFEAAVFNGKVGVVQKPIETQFGYHVVKVTDKMSDKFVIEKISNKIEASATTIDKIFNDASDFAYLADKNSFEEEAKTLNYEIKESIPFLETTGVVPGLGSNKALIKFAFENGVGDISEVFKVNAGYVVASVAEEMPAGYKTFEEVKPQIENLVKNEKKLAKSFELASQVKSNLGVNTNLQEAASAFSYTKYNTATDFTRSSSLPGAGKDFALTDFAFETELNKVTGPVKGQRASYLVKVTYRTELNAGAYESQRGGFRDNLLAQKRSTYFSQWVQNLKNDADIEDLRYKYFK